METKSKKGTWKYGLWWDDASFYHPFLIEITLYANDHLREEAGKDALSKDDHMRNALRTFLPETIFDLNKWSNEIIDGWCYEDIFVIWGSSSSGKSGSVAAVALADLLAAPASTKISLTTTPMRMHYDRCFGSMLKWYSFLPRELKIARVAKAPQPALITCDSEGQIAGCVCISTKDGESKEDLKSKIGAHQKRNRLIVDEPQNGSESVLSVKANFGASGEYKELHMGNPDGWFSPLGKISLPHCLLTGEDLDTEKVMRDEPDGWRIQQSWRGKHGKCIVFDGRKSPAFERPELEYYLAGRTHIEDLIHDFGEDSMQLWTYGIGRMPPSGTSGTLISSQDIINAGAVGEPATLMPPYKILVGLDPSQGENGVVITRTKFGNNEAGVKCAAVMNTEHIRVKVSRGDVSGQIAAAVAERLRKWGVSIKDFSCDANGNQGAVIDRIEQEVGQKGAVRLLTSGNAASDRRISDNGDIAKDHYKNLNTEVLYSSALLVSQGRVSGLNDAIAKQMSSRRVSIKNGKLLAEDKDDWKGRNEGNSPDEMDSYNCTIYDAIKRNIIKPYLKATVERRKTDPNNPFAPYPDENRQMTGYAKRARRASNIARAGRVPRGRR